MAPGGQATPRKLPRGGAALDPQSVERVHRERLQAAVVELIAKQGYAATTVEDLTSAATVSTTGFYALYRNKRECVVDTWDALLAELDGELAAAAQRAQALSDTTPAGLRAQLGEVIGALCAAGVRRPAATQVLLQEAGSTRGRRPCPPPPGRRRAAAPARRGDERPDPRGGHCHGRGRHRRGSRAAVAYRQAAVTAVGRPGAGRLGRRLRPRPRERDDAARRQPHQQQHRRPPWPDDPAPGHPPPPALLRRPPPARAHPRGHPRADRRARLRGPHPHPAHRPRADLQPHVLRALHRPTGRVPDRVPGSLHRPLRSRLLQRRRPRELERGRHRRHRRADRGDERQPGGRALRPARRALGRPHDRRRGRRGARRLRITADPRAQRRTRPGRCALRNRRGDHERRWRPRGQRPRRAAGRADAAALLPRAGAVHR